MSSLPVISKARTKIYALKESEVIRYVGKTKLSLESRLSGHLLDVRRGNSTHKANWIRSLLCKGLVPTISLLEIVEGNGNKEEIAWIKYFRDHGVELTNATNGGDGGAMCPEAIEKMRASLKGRHCSTETRLRMSESHKGHFMSFAAREKSSRAQKGRIRSQEAIEKNRVSHVGLRHTGETKRKMSESHMGHLTSEETKIKISKAQKGRPGRKQSSETKEKISHSMSLVRQRQRLEIK